MKKLIYHYFAWIILLILILTTLSYCDEIETIEVYWGNSVLWKHTIKDKNADERNLTGYIVKFRLCANADDYVTQTWVIDPVPSFTNFTQSGTTLGQCYLQLTKTQMQQTPGTYHLYLDIVNQVGDYIWTSNKYYLKILN